jgi:rod shape-determining protein MreB
MRPTVLASVPVDCPGVHERALEQAFLQVGAGRVIMVPAPLAAAAGSRVLLGQDAGGLLVDLGAGTADLAVFAYGRMVAARSLPVGGDALDRAVVARIRRDHRMEIEPVAAERLRVAAEAPADLHGRTVLEVRGRHIGRNAPVVARVGVAEIHDALAPLLAGLVDAIADTLARCPAELGADILDCGLALTGGLARGAWTRARLQDALGVPVAAPEDPDVRTILGLGALSASPQITARGADVWSAAPVC